MSRFQPMIGPGSGLAFVALVVIVLAGAYALIRIVSAFAEFLGAKLPRRRAALMRLVPVVRIAVWLMAAYFFLTRVFVPSSVLYTLAALVGIATVLAAQDVLRGIVGGITIALDRPFQVGDRIEVGQLRGEVVGIGLRATKIRTPEGAVVFVPNSEMVRGPVANVSGGEAGCAVAIDLVLPYDVDTHEVRRIAYEAAATSPYTQLTRPIAVRIQDDFRGTFLTRVRVEASVHDHRLEDALVSDVTERARQGFAQAGISVAPVAPGEAAAWHVAKAREEAAAGGES